MLTLRALHFSRVAICSVYRTRYWSPLYDTIVPLNDSSSCVISLLRRLASINASSARFVSSALVSSGSRDGLISVIPALTVIQVSLGGASRGLTGAWAGDLSCRQVVVRQRVRLTSVQLTTVDLLLPPVCM